MQFSLMSLAGNIKVVAVVQCAIALERCSGFHCSWAFHKKKNYFKDYSADTIYVPFSCGGCPGRRVSRLISNLAKGAQKLEMVDKDNIVVHLTACVVTDNGHYPKCPFRDYMKVILLQKGFNVTEGGYESGGSKKRRENNYYKAYSLMGCRND